MRLINYFRYTDPAEIALQALVWAGMLLAFGFAWIVACASL